MKSLSSAVMVLLVGCGGQTLDVGNNEAAGGATSNGNATDTTQNSAFYTPPICDTPTYDAQEANWPDPAACAATATGTQSDIVGTWEGYAEDEYFVPIKKYRLTLLAASSGGAVCGTVKYGEGDPPPMTDDPTAWYPPVDSSHYSGGTPLDYYGAGYGRASPWLLNGATYTIVEGGQLNNQLALSISMNEHLRGFCNLQSAYKTAPDASWGPYGCMPSADRYDGEYDGSCTGIVLAPPESVKFSAAQCIICAEAVLPGRCACDSCHCTARVELTHKIDLTFSGDAAVGTIVVRSGPTPTSNTLRLKRVVE
jgi:hypothetical protein